MRNIKTKNIGKIMAIGITSILFLSGMGGVSACYVYTELVAGQNTLMGYVQVVHMNPTADTLYIKYETTGGWKLDETHLAVAESFSDIPTTKKGSPKIGHFPYKMDHDETIDWKYTYTIDLNDFPGLYNSETGEYHGTLYISAHAVIVSPEGVSETGWADTYGQPFPGGNSWALWFTIVL